METTMFGRYALTTSRHDDEGHVVQDTAVYLTVWGNGHMWVEKNQRDKERVFFDTSQSNTHTWSFAVRPSGCLSPYAFLHRDNGWYVFRHDEDVGEVPIMKLVVSPELRALLEYLETRYRQTKKA